MNNKGCDKCNDFYQFQTKKPEEIASSSIRQAALFKCPCCGSFWEEGSRYASFLTKEEVAQYYGSQYLDGIN